MVSRLNNAAPNVLDANQLGQLKAQAKHTPDDALKSAAKQFESVFLNMMLKTMREATPQDGMMDSEQTKLFTGMLDQQLAQNMANKGIGLADMLVKQLTPPDANGKAANGKPGAMQSPGLTLPRVDSMLTAPAQPVQTRGIPSAFNQNTQQEFVDKMLPHATRASRETGVPSQLMLGQAALESGWGRREIKMPDGSSSFNLFGIKANAGWNGKVAEVTTTEYTNGVAHKEVAKFRAYSSYDEAFQDYAKLLSENPRYANVMQQGGDTAGMAQAIQNAGYATDPQYADKLTRVVGSMNLPGL